MEMMTVEMALTKTIAPQIHLALYVHITNLLVYLVTNVFPKVTIVTFSSIVWTEVMKLDAVSDMNN